MVVNKTLVSAHMEKVTARKDQRIELDPECLRWTPLISSQTLMDEEHRAELEVGFDAGQPEPYGIKQGRISYRRSLVSDSVIAAISNTSHICCTLIFRAPQFFTFWQFSSHPVLCKCCFHIENSIALLKVKTATKFGCTN